VRLRGLKERIVMESRFGSRRKKSGSTQAILGVALSSLLLGGLVTGYFLWDWGNGEPEQGDQPVIEAPAISTESEVAEAGDGDATEADDTPSAAEAAEVVEAAQAVERVAEQQGGLDQRLAAAEQRLARLDLQAQAAAGNAARAEGLLIAFATRRALERRAELGYLADQLRLRFGDALPNAVRTVVAFSREPVTVDELAARLDSLGPELSQGDRSVSWESFTRELAELFVVRREATPSPQPERRLERARISLESGRIDAAIGEVRNLPGADKADSWIADAERYRDAMDALERIETAAVLEPRLLRDGAGNAVEQLSPVGE
jgi:hypothetical protein